MAHETLTFGQVSRQFHHLELELCFRAMARFMRRSNDPQLQAVAALWETGLENAAIGLIDVDLDPHFVGMDDRDRLLDILSASKTVIPEGESIPVSELNAALGSQIATHDGSLAVEVVDAAFRKLQDFISNESQKP